jgi:uridine kinase
MEPFSPVNHFFYSPTISPNMPISLGLTSGFTLHNASQLTKQPFIIGICGGSCSGKSQVTERVKMSLDLSASVINEFDFYFPNLKSDDNFDSPDSIDWDLLTQCLTSLKSYGTFDCPQYNMIKHKKKRKPLKLFPTPIIIVEGLFIFGKEEIRKMIDLSLFIDCPDDVRLGHRVRKFTKEMGMELEFILDYYLKYTKVAYEKYIEPVRFI